MQQHQYLQVDFLCSTELTEILIAELAELNYDSFWEKEDGFTAYIQAEFFNENQLKLLLQDYSENKITYHVSELENRNWNQEWERNFEPIVIADKCYVRATFHEPKPEFPLEIIIDPKMSFGTGHHATTSMMIEHLLQMDVENKKVMDVGCGTGILAIAASKLGANQIIGFDVEDWTVENANENKARNNTNEIEFINTKIEDLNRVGEHFDIILANITRNILLEEFKIYATYLAPKAKIAISGFYESDIDSLVAEAKLHGLYLEKKLVLNNWASLLFSN